MILISSVHFSAHFSALPLFLIITQTVSNPLKDLASLHGRHPSGVDRHYAGFHGSIGSSQQHERNLLGKQSTSSMLTSPQRIASTILVFTDTYSNITINGSSFCPTSHKDAAFHSLIHRMISLPLTTPKAFDTELNYIKRHFAGLCISYFSSFCYFFLIEFFAR